MRRFTIILLTACAVLISSDAFCSLPKSQEIMRIRILKDIDTVNLTVDTCYKIYSLKDGAVLKQGKRLRKAKVSAIAEGILLGNTLLTADSIKIVPGKDAKIYIDKWRLRGEVNILKTPELKLAIVNNLGIEDYLYGVLHHEISYWWPNEVIKAQAIAARTYALYQKRIMQAKPYDLTADIYSQVYGGRATEKWKTNMGVNSTRGMVLTYDGDIFPAYFHATCGGFTEDAANLWKIDIPPLKGAACPFCRKSKHYRWRSKVSLKDIEAALTAAGINGITDITSIEIESRNRSNRINNLIIKTANGPVPVAGKDFRLAMGPNKLRSNNYELKVEDGQAYFNGIGWGHGVGMCQWGAYFMAKKGYKAEAILQYYYPGAMIEKR